ncbi:MAG: hypothetical protein KKE05_01940, partial [Nanoarchaeota archaeon]|nr:hypothetical protein [Nanoarchaeota archaeon]
MKKLTAFIFVTLILTQLASADLIAPGFKVIPTTNKITNMDDFPDHVFIFTAKLGESVCALEKIENDGVLPSVYKFCQPSVYAIEKSNFNEEEFQNLLNLVSENRECPQLESYLTNSNAKLIVTDIRVYNQV